MKNGGSAFPVTGRHVDDGNHYPLVDSFGMTLRDYFAAAALTGDLAASANARERPQPGELAAYAYSVADAMLAERERQA